jgi:membrane dipeptidase
MLDLSHLNERGFWDVAEISSAPLVASHSNVHALSATPRNLLDTQLDAIKKSNGLVGVNFAVAFTRDDGKKDRATPLALLARHFEYMCERIGPEHVAFGSDFDGTVISDEMGDVLGLPKLVQILRDRGFSEADLKKMGHENWLRVLGATWKG